MALDTIQRRLIAALRYAIKIINEDMNDVPQWVYDLVAEAEGTPPERSQLPFPDEEKEPPCH